jgi:hypothetical protein
LGPLKVYDGIEKVMAVFGRQSLSVEQTITRVEIKAAYDGIKYQLLVWTTNYINLNIISVTNPILKFSQLDPSVILDYLKKLNQGNILILCNWQRCYQGILMS